MAEPLTTGDVIRRIIDEEIPDVLNMRVLAKADADGEDVHFDIAGIDYDEEMDAIVLDIGELTTT